MQVIIFIFVSREFSVHPASYKVLSFADMNRKGSHVQLKNHIAPTCISEVNCMLKNSCRLNIETVTKIDKINRNLTFLPHCVVNNVLNTFDGHYRNGIRYGRGHWKPH